MDELLLITEQVRFTTDTLAYFGGAVLTFFIVYETLMGRYSKGKKTKEDWWMGAIALTVLALVQRPALLIVIFLILSSAFPHYSEALRWLSVDYFWASLLSYILIDEYLHGRAHLFAHSPRPKHQALIKVQAFYKIAHRPHHQLGGTDNKGELSVTQTFVEHWGWWIALPNYWFGIICLYFGLYEVFFWGTLMKSAWGMHVHTNWGTSYDIYLLNHRSKWVRKIMAGLCHVLVFPNMHHHHHGRGPNSAKNMTNFIAVFDWLVWKTLVIENKRPEIYGWRQSEAEAQSPLYRYFNTDLSRV